MFTLKNAPTDTPFLNKSGSALSRDSTDLDLTFPGYRSQAMVLLLLTFCLLLLPLWESVIVLCFVVHYFMSILVLQSS